MTTWASPALCASSEMKPELRHHKSNTPLRGPIKATLLLQLQSGASQGQHQATAAQASDFKCRRSQDFVHHCPGLSGASPPPRSKLTTSSPAAGWELSAEIPSSTVTTTGLSSRSHYQHLQRNKRVFTEPGSLQEMRWPFRLRVKEINEDQLASARKCTLDKKEKEAERDGFNHCHIQ